MQRKKIPIIIPTLTSTTTTTPTPQVFIPEDGALNRTDEDSRCEFALRFLIQTYYFIIKDFFTCNIKTKQKYKYNEIHNTNFNYLQSEAFKHKEGRKNIEIIMCVMILCLVLSLFTVIRFKNEACKSGSGSNGTCYSSGDCSAHGGQASGSCAQGFGVCCLCKSRKM